LGAYKAGSDFLAEGAELGLRAGFAASVADAEGTTAGMITEFSSQALDKTFPNTSVIPIPAALWSGITIEDADFGLIDVIYEGNSVEKGSTDRHVKPKAVGTTIVRVLTIAGALGPCSAVQGTAQPFEVRENNISISPSGGQVKPDQEIDFTATVTDAKNLAMEWIVSHGTVLEEFHNLSTGLHTMKWKAPPENEMPDGPITITGRSLASDCLRVGVERRKDVILTPYATDYILEPASQCVRSGSTQVFQVLDVKFGEVPEVTWQLIGAGSLAPDGASATYTAPDGEGIAFIRATVASDPVVVLEQELTYGECNQISIIALFDKGLGPSEPLMAAFNITDINRISDPAGTEVYATAGVLNLTTLGGGAIEGTLTGSGITFLYPDGFFEGLPFDDGSETYSTIYDNSYYEYTLTPRVTLAEESPTLIPVEWLSPSRIRVHLEAEGQFDGDWPEPVQEASFEWTFSDGTGGSGKQVAHDFDVGPRFDHWILIKVTDTAGHSASYTQKVRLVDFLAQFSGYYEPDAEAACFAYPIPGLPGGCEGSITLAGPHAGTYPQQFIFTQPDPEDASKHVLNLQY